MIDDVESRDWLARLAPDARDRDGAVAELHALLLRTALYAAASRRDLSARLGRSGVEEVAAEAAAEATLAVLAQLREFRGESRFTTWASKFAVLQVAVALRRRRWLHAEIPDEQAGWRALSLRVGPHAAAEQAELLAALECGVRARLTQHQRRVFVALALNEVPLDVLAEKLGTTRGALYKTLHDARQRLRAHLATAGVLPDGWAVRALAPAGAQSSSAASAASSSRSSNGSTAAADGSG